MENNKKKSNKNNLKKEKAGGGKVDGKQNEKDKNLDRPKEDSSPNTIYRSIPIGRPNPSHSNISSDKRNSGGGKVDGKNKKLEDSKGNNKENIYKSIPIGRPSPLNQFKQSKKEAQDPKLPESEASSDEDK